MKENEKRGILILIILSIVVVVVLVMIFRPHKNNEIANGGTANQGQTNNGQVNNGQGEYVKTNAEGEKVNTSEKINSTKEAGEYTLSNVSLKETNGETVMSARITNKSGRDQGGFFGNIVLVDKSNKEIGKIPVKVSDMKAGETREIGATITESYAENAYDYRLEK